MTTVRISGSAQRGSTMVELMMAMVILAVVMSLAAFEIRSIVQQHNFVQSHQDAQEQARVAMAKMTAAVKQASVDFSNFNPPAGPVIAPTATPGNLIQYYQVAGLTPDALPTTASGAPLPCYNVITLAYQTPAPKDPEGTIQETVTPAATPCPNFTYPAPVTIAQNVDSFGVLVIGGSGQPTYQLNLTIRAQLATDIGMQPTQYSVSETIVPLVYGQSL